VTGVKGSSTGLSRLARGALLLGLAMLCGAFTRPPQEGESIELSRRHWWFICTGSCPNYDVIVQPSGQVTVIRRYFDTVDDVRRFRISPARLARLRAIVEPFRPDEGTPEPDRCDHHLTPEEEADMLVRTVEMEVKWAGPGRSYHLVACDTPEYAALRTAMDSALRTLGLEASAFPLE
jgi:Domain of unknown function (DUF6438)